MALITAGYWPSNYWPACYWSLDCWPESPAAFGASDLLLVGYWSTIYWPPSYWNKRYWPGYQPPTVGGPGHPRKFWKPPPPPWFISRRKKGEDEIARQVAKAIARTDSQQAEIGHQDELYRLDLRLLEAAREIDNRIAQDREQDQTQYKRRRQSLLNLERAKFAKAKKQKRAEEIKAKRLENLKKARAAKKRKRKKKKK